MSYFFNIIKKFILYILAFSKQEISFSVQEEILKTKSIDETIDQSPLRIDRSLHYTDTCMISSNQSKTIIVIFSQIDKLT